MCASLVPYYAVFGQMQIVLQLNLLKKRLVSSQHFLTVQKTIFPYSAGTFNFYPCIYNQILMTVMLRDNILTCNLPGAPYQNNTL